MAPKPGSTQEVWPRTFVYKTFDNVLWGPWLVGSWMCLPALFFVDPVLHAGIAKWWATRGPVGTVWSCTPLIIVQLLYFALMLPHLSRWQETVQKFKEKIEVTPENLIWRNGDTSKTLRWCEVSRYYLRPSGLWNMSMTCIVKSPVGEVQWTAGLQNVADLMSLTRRFATEADVKHWNDPEKRNGTKPGESIFDYRSYPLLKLLLVGSFLDLYLVWMLLYSGKPFTMAQNNAVPLAIFVLPVLWGWWRYFTAKVTLRPDGIRHATAIGERFMPWAEVQGAAVLGGQTPLLLHIRGTSSNLWLLPNPEWSEELRDTVNTRVAAQPTAMTTPSR